MTKTPPTFVEPLDPGNYREVPETCETLRRCYCRFCGEPIAYRSSIVRNPHPGIKDDAEDAAGVMVEFGCMSCGTMAMETFLLTCPVKKVFEAEKELLEDTKESRRLWERFIRQYCSAFCILVPDVVTPALRVGGRVH